MTDDDACRLPNVTRDMAFIDASGDAIVWANEKGRVTVWNEAAERLFGLAARDAIGQSLDIIIPEPMRGAHAAGIKRVVAGGERRVVGQVIEVIAQHAVTGVQFPIEMSISMWTEGEERRFGAIIRDISLRRRNEEKLHQLAHFDQLTLLPNRTFFLDRLNGALAGGETQPLTVMMIDLDGFKEVNDLHGHAAGDAMLQAVALRLLRRLNETADARRADASAFDATLARLGGDEFAVLLLGALAPEDALGLADKLREALAEPFTLDQRAFLIGASIGLAMAPAHAATSAELLANADLALYRAKEEGGLRAIMFEPLMRLTLLTRRLEEEDLRRGWRAGEFEIFFQPQVRLSDYSLIGAEALLRWRHPQKGVLAPAKFLNVLESMDLSKAVGDWALALSCRQAAAWRERSPEFRVSVNLFESQLRDPGLSQVVQESLSAARLPAESLELEITETALLHHDEASVRRLRILREIGVGIAFDDYGTGYASLGVLKLYPITRLKIDRAFVQGGARDRGNIAIIKAILSFGQTFNLSVTAEGVETNEQHALLSGLGCKEAQGYLYGRPMPATDFDALITRIHAVTHDAGAARA